MDKTNNDVRVVGKIVTPFSYSHEVLGERFYQAELEIPRLSETMDVIPFIVSERLFDVNESGEGEFVSISGQFRSFNKHYDSYSRLILSVFANEIELVDDYEFGYAANRIKLNGFICKKPIYRKTPLGREIADVLLAVNRPYAKSDYIPCVLWGRNARFASELEVGDRLEITGRIQSREYIKKFSDTKEETRIAYEVSVHQVRQVAESEVEE